MAMVVNRKTLFQIKDDSMFNDLALTIFRMQARENPVYGAYLNALNKQVDQVNAISEIPFLPIEFFKTQSVIIKGQIPEITFTSSGTTGMQQSRHLVSDLQYYIDSYNSGFRLFYGDPKNMAILALLPSYLEREGSSLIYMVDDLIRQASPHYSGYFLYNHDELNERLHDLKKKAIPTLLIGVTYALLDFIDAYTLDFPDLIIMETGGMKGKRKEMIRDELHEKLCKGFGVQAIHSEYGMTELLSQAYSKGHGRFYCPPWMKVLTRDVNDPLSLVEPGFTGGINIIDLANSNSCSFIATQDLGRLHADNSFEIIGRFDESDVRGCNLLVQ